MSHAEFFKRLPQYQSDGADDTGRERFEFAVPEFPLHALPPSLAKTVEHFTLHNRTSIAANATAALTVLGACAGKRLRVDTHPGRYTLPNLYAMVAQRSGRGKSEAVRLWLPPVYDFEGSRLKAFQEQRILRQTRLQVLEAQLKKLKALIPKAKDENHGREIEREMASLNEDIDFNQAQMVEPQLLVNDATQEALSVIMAANDEFAFSMTAEGKIVVQNLLGKYNEQGESEDSLYLKAFSGDFWRSNRISRNRVHLQEPYMACLWMVQISVLKRILAKKELMEDGLLPRFLFCVCTEPVPEIDPDLPPPDKNLLGGWATLCTSALRTYHSGTNLYTVPLGPGVYRYFVEFANAAIVHMNNGMEDVGSFVARWTEISFRLALILHLALHGVQAHTQPISLQTADDALTLIKYYAEVQMNLLAPQREDEQFRQSQQLYRLLIERYGGSQTLRELNRRNNFTSKHVEALAEKYPNLFRLEDIPTTSGGSSKRMVSAVKHS